MRQKGLTQAQIATQLKVTPQAISDLLAGRHSPRLDKVDVISEALGVPTFYLLMSPEDRAKWDGINQTPPQENALWEAIKQIQIDIKEIKSGTSEPFLAPQGPPGYLLPEFEKLAKEIELSQDADLKKKRERKRGNG